MMHLDKANELDPEFLKAYGGLLATENSHAGEIVQGIQIPSNIAEQVDVEYVDYLERRPSTPENPPGEMTNKDNSNDKEDEQGSTDDEDTVAMKRKMAEKRKQTLQLAKEEECYAWEAYGPILSKGVNLQRFLR